MMFDFISEYWINIVLSLVQLLVIVLSIVRGRLNADTRKTLEELEEMKFKLHDNLEPKTVEGQAFEAFKPVYRFNKATGELEKTEEKIDIQALVDSFADSAFDKIMQRLQPVLVAPGFQVEQNRLLDDLDILHESSMLFDDYRQEYNMPNASNLEILDAMQKRLEDIQKEVKLNETSQTQPAPQPQNVPADGSQGSPEKPA